MKILIKPILFFFLFIEVSYADLIKPNSELKPFDVLSIQLNSLKNNNFPYKDAGIEQAWEFAHPFNKVYQLSSPRILISSSLALLTFLRVGLESPVTK